jgi:hypothetical protein
LPKAGIFNAFYRNVGVNIMARLMEEVDIMEEKDGNLIRI